jgi:hypothetical protein
MAWTRPAKLRAEGWTVVRIRQAELEKLDDTFDVVIRSAVAEEDAAAEVLDYLAFYTLPTRPSPRWKRNNKNRPRGRTDSGTRRLRQFLALCGERWA